MFECTLTLNKELWTKRSRSNLAANGFRGQAIRFDEKITIMDHTNFIQFCGNIGSLCNIWDTHFFFLIIFFFRKTFRRRVFLKIVAYHIVHIHKRHATHIVSTCIDSIRIHSIRMDSTRIDSARIHSMRIHSIRIIAYYCISRNGNLKLMNVNKHISLHFIASAGMAMNTFHIGGNGYENKTCIYFHFIADSYICISLYRARMNMQCMASWWPACLLAFACSCACF